MTRHQILFWPAVGITAAVLFLTTAIAVFAASPTVSVTGGSTPLSSLSVSGSGFTANEPIHLSLGLSSANTTANATGAFSGASLTIPNIPSGNYIVIAVGQNSGLVAFAYIYVSSFFPTVNPSSWYIAPGSTLTWSGSGFAPNESVTIADSSNTQIASFNANASGGFTAVGSSVVPFNKRNSSTTYTVKGTGSGVTIPITIMVADIYPYASPSSWYILPGKPITFSGSGFGPNEGVNVYLGTNTSVLAHFGADSAGAFTAQGSVAVPYGSGVAAFRLVGDSSGATAQVPVTRADFYPSFSPSAYYSAPGSVITLGGSGFAPNENATIMVGGAVKGIAPTNSTGAFSNFPLTLPATPNTTPVVSGKGGLSGATASYTMAIGAYYSWITLNNYYAQGGTALIISGHNYLAGETVTATAGSQTLGSGVASNTGDVTINATVPFVIPGAVTISAKGGTSGAVGTSDMTVAQVWTDLQLGGYAGKPGDAVRFVGHGYLPNDPIEVTTDRTGTTVVATFTADGTGSFDNSSYHTPSEFIEGNLTFTVKSKHSFDNKTIKYYVTGK